MTSIPDAHIHPQLHINSYGHYLRRRFGCRVSKVNVDGESYECATHYMIRLEKSDMEGEKLKSLAALTNLTADQFKERFGKVVAIG